MNTTQNFYQLVRSGDITAFANAWRALSNDQERSSVLQIRDQAGMGLLHIAAQQGHLTMVQILLSLEVDITSTNHLNQTPLEVARLGGHAQIATLLQTRMAWKESLQHLSAAIPLNKTLSLIQGAYNAIEGGRNKKLVLALGETGVGKSTLINYLNGASYRKTGITGFNERTELISGQEIARVGHNAVISETLYPQVFNLNNSLNVADLAGINGTREPALELAGTLSTHLLARIASGIKAILFVIDVPTLQAGRGGKFRDTVQTLDKILGGQFDHQTKPSVLFAITKVPQGVTVADILTTFITPIINQITSKTERTAEDIAMLNTLQLMQSSSQQIFIPDVFDNGACRQTLLNALQQSPGLSAEKLNLLNVDKHQQNFNTMLTFLSNEFNRRSREVVANIPKARTQLNEQISALESKLVQWNGQIAEAQNLQNQGMSNEARRQLISEKAQQLGLLGEEIESQRAELGEHKTTLRDRSNMLEELDTDEAEVFGEPICFSHTAEIITKNKSSGKQAISANDIVATSNLFKPLLGEEYGAFSPLLGMGLGLLNRQKNPSVQSTELRSGSGEIVLNNDKTPAPGNILDIACNIATNNAEIKDRNINGNKFSVTLNYPYGQSVMAQVYAKIAKRDLPVNRAKIERYRSEIESHAQRIAELDANLITLKTQRQALETERNELQDQGIDEVKRIEQLNSQIQLRQDWINQATQQCTDLNASLDKLTEKSAQLALELEVNRDMFATIYAITETLALDNNNPIIAEFMQEYAKFQQEQQHNTAPQANM